MSEKKNNTEKIKRKLLNKFRIVVVNEDTLEEKASIRLNRLNVLTYGSIFSVIMIILTLLTIIYTPLKQYILGFSEAEMRQQIVDLTFKTDSLTSAMQTSEAYFSSIQKVLKGEIVPEDLQKDSARIKNQTFDFVDIEPNEQELKLRQEVSEIEKYSTFDTGNSTRGKNMFFSPISGSVSNAFSLDNKHFGVDVVAQEGSAVKAITDGKVLFAEWSIQTGNVIILQHANDFVSVYKHNSSLSKKQGDFVKAGEVIATVGNTGEYSSGVHLHFELWKQGYAVDPFNYINFK